MATTATEVGRPSHHGLGLFSPLRERLDLIEDEALGEELVTPVSPRGRNGWEAVDTEVAELRRHFHGASSPHNYRNIGNDLVVAPQALSAVAYDQTGHPSAGEVEPPAVKGEDQARASWGTSQPGSGATN